MNTKEKILSTDFESLPTDPFWNTGNEREDKMHRIHTYPAKFPAFITTKALEYAKRDSVDVKVVADCFCGCGTTAYEAKRNNIDFWGCDINPVATMIAKTKSQKYQSWRLKKYYKEILDGYKSTKITEQYINANDRLKYWFREKEYNQLWHLKKIIQNKTPENSIYRRFFICAFSNILKPTSVWLTKSIKPQVDPYKEPSDVFEVFKKQCAFMIKANEESTLSNSSLTTIETCSILDKRIETPIVDLIITSPPYVTSYEYADLHQLSTLWLSYTDDYRDLRGGSIGSLYHSHDLYNERELLNITGKSIVSILYDKKNHRAKSIEKYFLDMQSVAKKAFSILNKKGIALFIIANTEYQGIYIDNAKHLSESLFNSGFSKIEVMKRKISNKTLTPYRDEKGRFTTDIKGRLVYSEEFVVIGRK